jgi:hypothetical protein
MCEARVCDVTDQKSEVKPTELDEFLSTFNIKFRQLGRQGWLGALFDRAAHRTAQ